MSQSTPDLASPQTDGGDGAAGEEPFVVEAPTAAKALEAVTSELGPDATILSASKVTRGGIAGFFARELVQLRARPRGPGDPEPDAGAGSPTGWGAPVPASPETESAPAVTRILEQLASDVEQQETTFADALRRQLTLAGPAPDRGGAAGPAVDDPAPRRDWPTPRWSDRNLRLLGMPPLVTDAVAGLYPDDDLAWVQAIAGAVTTLCRPLPEGAAVYAGPRAERLAGDLDLVVRKPPASAPATGSFLASLRDTDRHRAWLERSRHGRWLHLVVGGDDWRGLVLDEPLAVSWVGDRAIGDALRLCADLGLVLGYRAGGETGAPARRANPVDVALTIRSLLPRA